MKIRINTEVPSRLVCLLGTSDEEVLDKGDIVNANIAYDIFMNVHRVLDVIFNEEDVINSAKLFVSAISSYLADNWNQSTAA